MSLNDILTYINSNKNVDGWIYTISKRRDLIGDLKQHCLLELSKEDLPKLVRLYNSGDLEKYFVQLIRNQYNSTSSSFFKEYVNSGFWSKDFVIYDDLSQYEDIIFEREVIDTEVKNKDLVRLIEAILMRADPLKVDLFRMKYFEHKSYNEISNYYGINYQVVRNKIRSVRDFVIDSIKYKK
jgi:hypothetical protein